MARITVEDCLKNIPNRFELVMAAAKRARQLEMENDDPKVPAENDKATVIALREIAAEKVTLGILDEVENPPQMTMTTREHFDSGDTVEAV